MRFPHKRGYVEKELIRIAEGEAPVGEQHFQMLIAEVLLMLLDRTKRLDGDHSP
jgi:hypothetical protein